MLKIVTTPNPIRFLIRLANEALKQEIRIQLGYVQARLNVKSQAVFEHIE